MTVAADGAARQGFHDFVKSAYPKHVAGSVVELALRVLTRAALPCNAFISNTKNIPDSSGVKPGMTIYRSALKSIKEPNPRSPLSALDSQPSALGCLKGTIKRISLQACLTPFVQRMQAHLQSGKDDVQIPLAQRRPPPLSLEKIERRAPDRNAAIVAAYATGGYSYQQLADHFGVHFTTVGKIVRGGG